MPLQLVAAVGVAIDWAMRIDLEDLTPDEASGAAAQISRPVQNLYLLCRELTSERRASASAKPVRRAAVAFHPCQLFGAKPLNPDQRRSLLGSYWATTCSNGVNARHLETTV